MQHSSAKQRELSAPMQVLSDIAHALLDCRLEPCTAWDIKSFVKLAPVQWADHSN